MFCIKCKKEIPENSAFCAFCGEKQKKNDIPDSSIDLPASFFDEGEESVDNEGDSNMEKTDQEILPPNTFSFGDYSVKIPDNTLASLHILNDLQKLAFDCSSDYVKFYTQCSGLEKVISATPSKVASYYQTMAEKVEIILLANDIAGVYPEELIEYNRHSYQAASILKNIRNTKEKLDAAKNNDFAYREARKNHRGKFVGGGFGLSGAVKGMAMAGAANMATGAAHNVFNIFGNAATKVAYNNRIRSLKNSGYCRQMAAAVEADCLLFINTLNVYLKRKARKELSFGIESISKSDKIITQIEEGKVPKASEMETLVKAFLAYPLNERFYELFCYKYMDEKGELVRCMEYLGLDPGQVKLIHASQAYCRSYFGDRYVPLVKERLQDEDLHSEGVLRYFYDEEINPFLMEDINNVPHLFMEASAEILHNREYCMTFEGCKNVHHLYRIQRLMGFTLDLEKEVPLFFIQLAPFSKKYFILITSKYVVLPDNRLKIHLIDDVDVTSDAVIFCNKYSVKQSAFYDEMQQEELLLVLLNVILYIQFAYNLNQAQKTIPLLGVYADNETKDPYQFLKEDYISAMAQYGFVSQYIASLFSTQNHNLITTNNSAKNMQFIRGELKKYHLTLQQEKCVLMSISDGLLGSKSGIYFTEQNLYYHVGKSAYHLPIEQIKKFDYDEGKCLFIINDTITIDIMKDKRSDEIADHFMQIVQLLVQNLILKTANGAAESIDFSGDLDSESPNKETVSGLNYSILEKIKKCCGSYRVSFTYDDRIAAGESVGPESIKNFNEVSESFELEPSDEIFFFNNDSSLFSGFQGLLLCSSGMKIISKRGKFFYGWEEFKKLDLRYTFLGDGLYINSRPVLPINAEGKKTYKLLKDIQEILNSV